MTTSKFHCADPTPRPRHAMKSALVAVLSVAAAAYALAEPAVLTPVADVPLPGRASRFDYQSFDAQAKRLYFAHMGDGALVVFGTAHRKVVASLPGFPTVTGVLVVPELKRVFVSVAGQHEVAVVDTESLKVLARIPAGEFPDGLAYAPEAGKVFVSDERGGKETVIEVKTNRRVNTIDLGGEVGNTQYDAGAKQILANVQTKNELVVIDPIREKIVARHELTGGDGPHGLWIDAPKRLAFAACERDAKLLVIDLETFQVKQVLATGDAPDVLAFDPGLERLYVAAESGPVAVFQLRDKTLEKLADVEVARDAHTVAVDSQTHEVYFPLKNVGGKPVLRIMKP